MRPAFPDKSPEELVADYRAAAEDLRTALGTDAEDAVVQRVADAIGALMARGSTAQLAELDIHSDLGYSVGLVLSASDPGAAELQAAVASQDEERIRAALLERGDIPPSQIVEITKSLLRRDDE